MSKKEERLRYNIFLSVLKLVCEVLEKQTNKKHSCLVHSANGLTRTHVCCGMALSYLKKYEFTKKLRSS